MNNKRESLVYDYVFSEGGTSFYVFPRFWITEDRESGVVEALPLNLEDYLASQPFTGGKRVALLSHEYNELSHLLNKTGKISFLNCERLVVNDNGKKSDSRGRY